MSAPGKMRRRKVVFRSEREDMMSFRAEIAVSKLTRIHSMTKLFSICPLRWYAMHIFLLSGEEHLSPIWIFACTPQTPRRKLLTLHFWHANYPAGVQSKSYELRVIRREAGYLLAERRGEPQKTLVLLSEITGDWLRAQFGECPDGDLQKWLERRCGRP